MVIHLHADVIRDATSHVVEGNGGRTESISAHSLHYKSVFVFSFLL